MSFVDEQYEGTDREDQFRIQALPKRGANHGGIFEFKKPRVPAMKGIFPPDFTQIPDVFIHFFCNDGNRPATRVGYIRKSALQIASKKENPQWHRIQSPYNDLNPNKLGQCLANI